MRTSQWVLFFIVSSVVYRVHAQDPVFSQFYAAPLQLNPAIVGVSSAPRFALNYRNQWPEWPNAYRTYAMSYEQPLTQLNSGFGLSLLADDAGNGIYKTLAVHLSYSYFLPLSDDYAVKFGIEGGGLQSRVDWSKLLFGDQLDPVNGATLPDGSSLVSDEKQPLGLQKTVFDLGMGMLIHSRSVYAGFALRHLNRPDESLLATSDNLLLGKPMRWSVHAGWNIPYAKGDHLRYPALISPNIQMVQQADFFQVNAGAYLGYDLFFGGLWYRHSNANPDAFIALVGVRQGAMRFGYSYDATLSTLGIARTGGTHEVSLAFSLEDRFSNRRKKKSVNVNDCFQIFR